MADTGAALAEDDVPPLPIKDGAEFYRLLYGQAMIARGDTRPAQVEGYAWQAAHCTTCDQSLGWRLVAMDSSTQPETFWIVLADRIRETLPS